MRAHLALFPALACVWLTTPGAFAQAIITTSTDGKKAFVLPDPLDRTSCQLEVTGLPGDVSGVGLHSLDYAGPDNALVADFGNSRIFNIRISTASVVATIGTGGKYTGKGSLAVAPGFNFALASGEEFKLAVIAAPFDAGATVTTVPLPSLNKVAQGNTQGIVFDAAGRAFVFHDDGASAGISVLDAPYSSIAFTIPVPGPLSGTIAISPDGNTLLTTDASSGNLRVFSAPFSAASTSQVLAIPGAGALIPVRITPDGTKALVTTSFTPKVFAVSAPFSSSSSVETLALPATLESGFEDIGISSDGQLAIVTGNSSAREPAVFIRAPFTAAGAAVSAVQIGTFPDSGRGNGGVRFRPGSPAPTLSIYTCAPATVLPGAELTYEITVTNNRPTDSANVLITDPLPAGTSFVSATDGGTLAAGAVTWNLGTVATTAERTVSFTVQVTATSGTIDNQDYTAQASGVAPLAGPLTKTRVIPVSISKSAPATVAAGGQLTYTITFGNRSGGALANVVVKDRLPTSTFFSSATDGGTFNLTFGLVTWNIGAVPDGTTRQISFTVDVNQFASGPIKNFDYWIEATGVAQVKGAPVSTAIGVAPPPPAPRTLTLVITKGKLGDSAVAAKDSFKAKGTVAFNSFSPDAKFDAAADAVTMIVGGGAGTAQIAGPAGAGWKANKKGVLTWKSAKGALPKAVMKLDPVKGTFTVKASKFTLAAAPEDPVSFDLTVGNDTGIASPAWRVKKPGLLTFP